MKFNKIVALILCAVCLMTVFTGCDKKVDDVIDGYTNTSGRDFQAAREFYPADELALKVEGEDITWDELFNWICYSIADYEGTYGGIKDFGLTNATGTMSDVILDNAEYYIALHRVVEKKAAEMGVEYPADIEDQLKTEWENGVEHYGSEEDYLQFLNDYYGGKDNFDYIYRVNSLYSLMSTQLYGENGANVTDQQIEENASDYIQAKHILIETVDDQGGELDLTGKIAARAQAEEVKAKLDAYSGSDLAGYFQELMDQYNQDDGAQYYPDGYLFTDGDMVDAFYKAAGELKPGEYSDIVETEYGYHIILRLPLNPDSIPINYAKYGVNYNLRYVVASRMFSEVFKKWVDDADVTETPFFETIDLSKVFPVKEEN